MLFTLVRKNRIHETGAESSTSERCATYDEALKKFYQYLAANVADTSVERLDITILNSALVPCKVEHYSRTYDEEVNAE